MSDHPMMTALTLTLAARLERIPVLEARPAVGTTRLCRDLSWDMMEPALCEVTESAKSSRVCCSTVCLFS